MSELVIQVEELSKSYQYGTISHGTLRTDLQSWWARLRGKDDPNAQIKNFHQPGQSGECFWALRDISFKVQQGTVLGIIGRNGAGKSTLLKILSEITTPTTGCVRLKGRVGSLLEVGTGFHPELTGRENVFVNGAILGMRKAEISRKFDEIVAFAEIEEFIDTPVKRYSSGMYVRLAFAVAAHLEPEILLIDEVLAVGDVRFQQKCIGKIDHVSKEGRTVLFVSHNMTAVSMLCSNAIWLEGGSLKLAGKTQDVIEMYLIEARDQQSVHEADIVYPDEPENPAQIKRIRISDSSGSLSLTYHLLQSVRIDIDFVIRRYFANLFVACTIFTPLKQIILGTNEMDWTNHTEPEMQGTFPKESGYYKASVLLPAPLLNTGVYELVFNLSNPTSGNIETREGIFIEVTDNKGSFASFPFKRRGFIVMPLEWQLEYRQAV